MYFLPHHQFKLDRLDKEANECTILFSRGGWGKGKGPGTVLVQLEFLVKGSGNRLGSSAGRTQCQHGVFLRDIMLV